MRTRVLSRFGVVVATVALACGPPQPGADLTGAAESPPGPPQVHVISVIASDQTGTGPCEVNTVIPPNVDARPGDAIVWMVDNRCKTQLQLTRLMGIRPLSAPPAGDPLVDDLEKSSGEDRVVPPGSVGKIVTRVKNPPVDSFERQALIGRYQYTIETNNRDAWFSICDIPPCPWDP